MSTGYRRLRSVSTRFPISDHLSCETRRQSALGPASLLVVRMSLGTLSVWTGTRRVGSYRGWGFPTVSRNVSSGAGCGLAIRETVVDIYSPPDVLQRQGDPVLGKEVKGFGNARSAFIDGG